MSNLLRSMVICAATGFFLRSPSAVSADASGPPAGASALSSDYQPADAAPAEIGDLADRILGFSDEEWAAFEVLIGLDKEQWRILQTALMVDHQQSLLFRNYLAQNSEDLGSHDSQSYGADFEFEQSQDPGSALRVPYSGLNCVLDKVQTAITKINGVKNVVDDIKPVVNTIKSTIGPDRPDVKDLLDKIELGRLEDLLDIVKDEAGGIVKVVQELKDGLDEFAPEGDCEAGTCAQFKIDFNKLFDDLEDAWVVLQLLQCLKDPYAPITQLNTELFRTLLTEKAPTSVLYVLYKFLEEVDSDWHTLVRQGLEQIPTTMIQFCDAVNPDVYLHVYPLGGPYLFECDDPADQKCCALKADGVETALKVASVAAHKVPRVFEVVDSWVSDDKNICAAGVAVGGAGAGTNIKNPVSGVVKTLKIISDRLPPIIDRLLAERDECMERDRRNRADEQRMEVDLLQCNAMVEYVLTKAQSPQHGKFEVVADLVDRRIDHMVDAGKATEMDTSVLALRAAIMEEDYNALCLAYKQLTGKKRMPPP